MMKTLLIVALVLITFGFSYWWFIPWRPVLKPFRLGGLKEANPDSLANKKGQRVLAITAHIDDLEFFCGGTMARLQEKNAETWLVIGTEDYKWYYSTKESSRKSTERRKEEQEEIADYFDYARVIYLGYPDNRLKNGPEPVEKVRKIIEEFKPEAILTFDVLNRTFIQHRDHTAAGIIALKAASESNTDAKVFMFSTNTPNFYVDVTDSLERKWTALKMFESEFGGNEFVFTMLRRWARNAGKKANTKYAESYHVVEFER